ARQVQLSAFWVFDFAHQPLATADIGTDNEFMLDAVVEANRLLRDRKDVGSKAGESGKTQ
ncbi:MAG: hypothetical protein ACO39C_09540, partial [Chthoniobacterales bacterium]